MWGPKGPLFLLNFFVGRDCVPKKKLDRVAPMTIEESRSKTHDNRKKYCRYCANEKDSRRFYKSFDFLDADGKMPICIDCVSYLFNFYYSIHSRIDVALYEVCRCINVRYDSRAYSSLMAALERNGMKATADALADGYDEVQPSSDIDTIAVDTKSILFGKYYAILQRIYANSDVELTFDVYKNDRPEGYEDKSTDKPASETMQELFEQHLSAVEKKWGKGYEPDDYAFLESEYNSWAKTKDVENKSVDLLIREVCMQQLKMRKIREDGGEVKKGDVDILTTLMDKCSITPDKEKESNSSKSQAAFGLWLKDVETLSPAEWVENQKLFKDVEGIDQYVKQTYDRAVKNYIGMQRDFRVISDRMEKEAEEFNPDDISGFVGSDDANEEETE